MKSAFRKEYDRKIKQIDKEQQEIDYLRGQFEMTILKKKQLLAKHKVGLTKFLTECPHEETTEESSYTEGGYLNRSLTERWTQCVLCKAKSEVTQEQGYYA